MGDASLEVLGAHCGTLGGMRPRAWWDERVLPVLVDASLNDATAGRWRELVASRASGRVLEVGFGSGRNLPFYGAAVTEVLAVEPSDLAWDRAASRVASFPGVIRRVGLDGAALPVSSGSVDCIVSTWTLCTIGDVSAAIREMARVLRPGGVLLYVEHVASPHPRASTIQRRVQPFWGRIAGGCELHRDIDALVTAGGFVVTPLSPRPDPGRFELVPFIASLARPMGR